MKKNEETRLLSLTHLIRKLYIIQNKIVNKRKLVGSLFSLNISDGTNLFVLNIFLLVYIETDLKTQEYREIYI